MLEVNVQVKRKKNKHLLDVAVDSPQNKTRVQQQPSILNFPTGFMRSSSVLNQGRCYKRLCDLELHCFVIVSTTARLCCMHPFPTICFSFSAALHSIYPAGAPTAGTGPAPAGSQQDPAARLQTVAHMLTIGRGAVVHPSHSPLPRFSRSTETVEVWRC